MKVQFRLGGMIILANNDPFISLDSDLLFEWHGRPALEPMVGRINDNADGFQCGNA